MDVRLISASEYQCCSRIKKQFVSVKFFVKGSFCFQGVTTWQQEGRQHADISGKKKVNYITQTYKHMVCVSVCMGENMVQSMLAGATNQTKEESRGSAAAG